MSRTLAIANQTVTHALIRLNIVQLPEHLLSSAIRITILIVVFTIDQMPEASFAFSSFL
jgi:hypothetical protein